MSAPQAVWGTAGTRREARAHAGVAGAEDWACWAGRTGETAVPVISSAAKLCLGGAEVCATLRPGRGSPLTLQCRQGAEPYKFAWETVQSLAMPGFRAPLLWTSACLM